ncbi:hypothetical protein A9Q87_13430 [Flavobacteriales bacterium 34_180_T64]|mgnify:CR=1 FL=1|nr:hypothetical protein A9Q87_13430 [Flavobacteriales bacterium 34_180_T64]
MVKKIFRLHKDGKTAHSGWFDSGTITSANLSTIITDGKHISTSIPSPFARIDLVKSAFQWVADNGIEGGTAQHKLVSDALDVGQLFFLSNLYPQIDIIEWNPKHRFTSLKNGVHEDLIETLETYWAQDGSIYNFNNVNRLFFILFDKQLVGCTSPSTLFFAAPDANSDNLNMNINRGNDKLLDNIYASLATREWSYIEYIFALSETPNFIKYFTHQGQNEFYNYLQKVKLELQPADRLKVDNINASSISKYEKCHVSGAPNNYCDVLGVPLGLQVHSYHSIADESDFVINSNLSNKKPLVLPFDMYSENLCFTTSDVKWNPETMRNKVPYRNVLSEDQSKIPVLGDEYYWLSIGNFLEDHIVEMPYELNSKKFELCGSKRHLMPLTKTFFEFFKVEDVDELLKISSLSAGGVEVKLEIPIKSGRKILYKKIYGIDDIVKPEIHLAIFPFVKVEDFPVKYNIGIIDGDIGENSNNVIKPIFLKSGNIIESSPEVVRSHGGNQIKSSYRSTESYFDCIQLTINSYNCMVIPKMPIYRSNNVDYTFAIDFGTTNTHIEYKKTGETLQPLKNEMPNTIWASLLSKSAKVDPIYTLNEATFNQEIIPHSIGTEDLSFPVRTALVENKDINYNNERELFKHINNFFLLEKTTIQQHLELTTALKWSNYSKAEDKKRVESYVEYLLSIVYYKVLLSNGKLENTKVIWFYPISMTSFQQGIIEDIWKKTYKKVFGDSANPENITKMAESIAPFYHYHNDKGIIGLSVSIDIGGGSSDISIFDDGMPKVISSFRFAGDAIYGDGYGGSPSVNGFVLAFKDRALEYLNDNSDIEKKEKTKILNNILEVRGKSNDFSSYLFALEKSSNGLFSYSSLIKQEMNIKLTFLLFYASIGFYIAKILKKEGFDVPLNYLFSGTGSKSLRIIDPSPNLDHISSLMKYIAEQVVGVKTNKVVSVLSEIPKEITCKGGLKSTVGNEPSIKYWLGGKENSNLDLLLDTESMARAPKFNEVRDADTNLIVESIEKFYAILDSYFETVNINNVFGIKRKAYDTFKAMRTDHLDDFLKKGIELKVESEGGDSNVPIEESLFFYPLIGVLNKLAFELASKD